MVLKYAYFIYICNFILSGFEYQQILGLSILKHNIKYDKSSRFHKTTTILFESNENQDDIALKSNLLKAISKEYASFFSPMEKKYYSNDVEFVDPLNKFQGINKYQNNVDLLAGRTTLGSLLFKDASIRMHSIRILENKQIETRWTLQVSVKLLPWQPRAKFTGISLYTLDKDSNLIIKQEDYWDSINLKRGKYVPTSTIDGLKDFLNQLKNENGAEMSAPELPYELLRRSELYEVRRYPATINIETEYDKRPEGYDRLGSYTSGSNIESKRLSYYSPTLMTILDSSSSTSGNTQQQLPLTSNTQNNVETKTNTGESSRKKIMSWPMIFAMPGESLPPSNTVLPESTLAKVNIIEKPSRVVAVTKFEVAATEPVVRGYTKQLLSQLQNDGLQPCQEAIEYGVCLIGQYDALFSINKRRNEVWVDLIDHPWK